MSDNDRQGWRIRQEHRFRYECGCGFTVHTYESDPYSLVWVECPECGEMIEGEEVNE